jgi:hypothetical protein
VGAELAVGTLITTDAFAGATNKGSHNTWIDYLKQKADLPGTKFKKKR